MLIATCVVLLHVFVLWALQSGLMRRAVEVIVPAAILSEFVNPLPPAPEPQTPVAPQQPKQEVKPVVKQAPTPPPLPTPTPQPAPVVAQPTAPAPSAAPPIEASTVAPAPAAPPAAPRIELPSSEAAHLNNPKPSYPALSRRLGEQGTVIVQVLIGIDGMAQQVKLKRTSGYERLDQIALSTVRTWRFVPGKRNGTPEAMWYDAPVSFVLE